MDKKLEAIRRACIKANPNKNWSFTRECDCPSREDIQVSLPYTLSDVLLAIETKTRKQKNLYSFEIAFPALFRIFYDTINWTDWNLLNDRLDVQSPETIDFLFNLLK